MTSVPSDPLIGQTLDERYVIRSRIARGGMAMVYLANDLRLERRVAVKVMHEHLAEDDNFTRRFEQEARSAARLSHPNLVNVFDQGQDLGRTYLVMEYLPSITLRDLLKQQKRLTIEQTLEVGEAVLAGLSAAHHAGIVHRDLKPENVMLADDGRIKLGDFGLARAVSANTTTGQALLGTIAYLSPELVTRGVADARSDLYAFGVMLYEMLTGTQPFTGEQPMQIAYQHAHSEVPVPSLKNPETPPELDELVRWTTQREPDNRPRDAGEALEYLTALRHGAPVQATRVLAPLEATTVLTPSTTVLDEAQQDLLAAGIDPTSSSQDRDSESPSTLTAAATAAQRRRARGRIAALIVAVLVVTAGGIGWWFGQGPGSQASVPSLVGNSVDEARAALTEHSLEASVTECSSLKIPVGKVASTKPEAGTRLDRGATVELCKSTGPAQKPVPTMVGLTVDEAKAAVIGAGFTFGKITEKRFSDDDANVVLAALGSDGEPLGDTYAEQGAVDFVVSAGSVPDVAGMKVKQATDALTKSELTVDPALGSEAHSDDVPEGAVISLVLNTDPVRPGDSVGLQVSLGPELFEIPDVSGMGLQEAMDALTNAGFSPTTLVPDALRVLATATETKPAAGEKVPAGTEISVKSTLKL
ncbi:Stk1 family PASTA domain-containing Ser/Thr kinase [Leucobacter viscericola]|uniref:non-specific serine/threonine protein kinase n=1 Tax=Leucobacter viscericola TaxID=2714935 RepID=A0A6G7XIJ6_9MICO|nr:Stk1 family PASTA domain-containing Ser/Thr kinase [Leucobacter viscericola]QIK64430.1 Stk1 family PASTA domain-containing Ser/Thr kinase [Leucobacter viscericola]